MRIIGSKELATRNQRNLGVLGWGIEPIGPGEHQLDSHRAQRCKRYTWYMTGNEEALHVTSYISYQPAFPGATRLGRQRFEQI